MKQKLILINPWVYDFAAYDLWAKPLGLLYLAARLRKQGFAVYLLDCLDVHNPLMLQAGDAKKPVRRQYGTGKFWKQSVTKPSQLAAIPRTYSRYGITPRVFAKELEQIGKPAAMLVTSLMTYWYPGVFEAIRLCKEIYPDVPVILGGIYATLCADHAARHSRADLVISSQLQFWPKELARFLKQNIADFSVDEKVDPFSPYPAFDLLRSIDYICVLGSSGCPFRCSYCASGYLIPHFSKRAPLELFEEIAFWHRKYHVVDFAFYDDALLVDATTHICVFLDQVLRSDLRLRFHCPNGVHISHISRETAELLYKAGFRSIRLGLETSDIELHRRLGEKFSKGEYELAVANLKRAGFRTDQIGSYILIGLPGQTPDQVAETITYAGRVGTLPYLSEYSPIPHTEMWKEAVTVSRFDLASDPLFHNNSIFPCWNGEALEKVGTLKAMVQEIRDEARKR